MRSPNALPPCLKKFPVSVADAGSTAIVPVLVIVPPVSPAPAVTLVTVPDDIQLEATGPNGAVAPFEHARQELTREEHRPEQVQLDYLDDRFRLRRCQWL